MKNKTIDKIMECFWNSDFTPSRQKKFKQALLDLILKALPEKVGYPNDRGDGYNEGIDLCEKNLKDLFK